MKINLNNPKGASFKENHLMTTARDAFRMTSIFRFRSLTNNLNCLNQSKHKTCDSKINLYSNAYFVQPLIPVKTVNFVLLTLDFPLAKKACV